MLTQRYAVGKAEVKGMDTTALRENFLVEEIFMENEFRFTYSHFDRMIVGGVKPVGKQLNLPNYPALKAGYFLERREMGIINVGGKGEIKVSGKAYDLNSLDCLYIGKGSEKVSFKSLDKNNPALFYILSAPAHHTYRVQLMRKEKASPVSMGAVETANQRTIYKYIHASGIKSCQLVMGLTILQAGSIWNTMPAHTHDRRMEVYFYFNLDPNHRVLHLMGEPSETRHIVVGNNQAIISPPWSIHAGAGTSSYGFIWGMAGENLDYSDMDPVAVKELR